MDKLKHQLDNIIHIGHDLGLYGLFLGITSLRKGLKAKNASIRTHVQNAQDLYDKIIGNLDSLIDDDLKNLIEDRWIRYSDKVLKLNRFVKENNHGQTIVFVERVHTAAFLSQVLEEISGKSVKIKYIAGSKACIDGTAVSTKYQVRRCFKKNLVIL